MLSKHRVFVERMRECISEEKRKRLHVYEEKNRNKIKNWDFKPGTLVQVHNSAIKKNLDRKMYARYKGPMVVIRRMHGGAYILAEMDGTVLKDKVATFQVMPHWARYEPIELPEDIHVLINLNLEQLEAMVEDNDEDS